MNFLRQGFRNLSSDIHTDRQTNKQTNRIDRHYKADAQTLTLLIFSVY